MEIIAATHAFYRENHQALGNRGYHVLYGPPIHKPPVLFIGFQPGGDQRTNDHELLEPAQSWPPTSYYATEDWKLARTMQGMFGVEFLTRCTGTNALFFRSPSMSVFYSETPGPTLVKCDQFCQAQVQKMVEVLNPQTVVCIGFSTLRRFGLTFPVLKNTSGRSLLEEGTVLGRPALATLHLSGARIAGHDLGLIADFIKAKSSNEELR